MSTLSVTTLQDRVSGQNTPVLDAIRGSAKAWVRFTGATGAIIGSYNVSGVNHNGTGSWTITLTNPLPDSNYCAVASATESGVNGFSVSVISSSQITISSVFLSGGSVLAYDPGNISLLVTR